ncbi:MAG: GDP-mannose 4,6-dehydratase [Sulfuritalea sp.]|nr:GDP-mannose 4,6-dehydratase [Sulfuritalea sp.]
MNRVPITGGTGFLGSHHCDRLVERGDDVLGVNDFFTGSKRNVAHLLDHPYSELMRRDVTFQALRWSPRFALEDGLKETIAYFRRILAK